MTGGGDVQRRSTTYDFVIVGAGAAGCVLANRLSAAPQHRVLLVEAGPVDRSPLLRAPGAMMPILQRGLYSWSYETEPQPHLDGRTLHEVRGKVLGGSTSINGSQHCRGAPQDFDCWQSLGNEGWSYRDVLPYFKRSERHSGGENDYHGGSGPLDVTRGPISDPIAQAWLAAAAEAGFPRNDDTNGADREGFGAGDETVLAGRRVSAASAFLKPVLSRANLTVVTGATARKLLMSGRRCTGLEYDRRGKTLRVEAGTVIVSAGVFGSPQLLMLSGIGDGEALRQHGIGMAVDLPGVGRNFRDHLGYWVSMTCSEPITDFQHMSPLKGARAIVEHLFFRRGLFSRSPTRAIGLVCSDVAEPGWPDLKMQLINVLIDDGPTPRVTRHGYLARISMTRPRSRGQVMLRSADPAAPPRIDGNYLADPMDIARARSGVRIARDIFRQPAFARYRGDEVTPGAGTKSNGEIDRWLRSAAGSDAHGVGTCRMGHDADAVVDPQLKVHGVEGLRVIDASVMPTHIGGNTVAPTMMIAEKGADLILLAG